ncbi:hypothetical protein UFOVP58_69 [uncultured Caudovirales phage]|uniref:Uncharacterized protein n=1 Tax=uncultured Caudovirales phage TaxID=2100421 RepID=A0A6J5KT76_9CAUD|nr:hypothetical protein UFOVP58_69 [uncultured Caudovirales phage]
MATYKYAEMASTAMNIVDFLKKKGITASVKTSRYQTQIKSVEVTFSDSLDTLIKQTGLNCTLSDISATDEKAISGKYKAKLLTLSSAVSGNKKGDSCFILNTYTEKGSLKTKDLAPEKLDLAGAKGYSTLDSFDKAVYVGITNLKVGSDIKSALTSLYKSVADNKTKTDSVGFNVAAKKAMASIKPQDKQAIGKDFGEILSLRWYLTQDHSKGWTQFGFSVISNEALVDFYVNKTISGKKIKSDVSAKFEAGAAPSIGAIVSNIDKVYKAPKPEEKKAIDVLKALAGDGGNTSTKILKAFETLKLPAYTKLKSVIGAKGNFTITDVSDSIQKIASAVKTPANRVKMFNTEFAPVYAALGKNASPDSLNVVFGTPTYKKYYSLILAPMGYALVEYMNKTKIYQDILNSISREMKTEQVYLNFSGDNMVFHKKLFSDAEFKFAYGANAKDSDNTGIKFSMK